MRIHRQFVYTTLGVILAILAVETPACAVRRTRVRFLFNLNAKMNTPSDVAVSASGNIYVVDGVNHKINCFGPTGNFLFSFGKKGSGTGEFIFPLGIDVDGTGTVYIADSGNHRVQRFDSKGRFLSLTRLSAKENPADPTDVAVDEKKSRYYVVDNDNHCIRLYDRFSGKSLGTYGTAGTEKRSFRYPFLMTLDKNGYLYIVDVVNTRVQVLNPEGLFVAVIGGWGVQKGQFFRPKGVALDKNNNVYVSDSHMGVIQVFDAAGEFHSVLGDSATGAVKRFKTPTGISIDGRNRLYVVEMFANRVGVYHIEADSP